MESIVETLLNPSVIFGLFVGVFISLLFYYILSTDTKAVEKISKKKLPAKNVKQNQSQQKQKSKDSHWIPLKKHSTHPSHVASFKGHTGEVLHADFSTNGKYLATCSDDDPGSTSAEDSGGSISSSSDSNKENILSKSNKLGPNLSRRQKKNRKPVQKNGKENFSSNTFNLKKPVTVPCGIGLTESQLYALLNDFTLLPEQLFTNGYPDLNEANNKVRVLRQCFPSPLKVFHNRKKCDSYTDSDQNSNSSDSCEDNELTKLSLGSSHDLKQVNAIERNCVRCKTGFFITNDEYLTKERCYYHWGKLLHYSFTCCKKSPGSIGCTTAKLHVWNGTVAGINEPLEGFVKTKSSKKEKKQKVYALDCEMCYTVKGLELCKVTILSFNGSIVYDHFVKPENEVVDYNTRYSGVTESDVNSLTSKTFSKVQSDILKLVTKDTILIGHGLDNDLRVLKLLHSKIVDTALIFPHERGYPFRYSLKHLMWTNLQKKIQTSDSGHSPYEDALSCLELIFFKIRKQHESQYYNFLKNNSYYV
ncbi:putative exonuclease GOR isoform X1 [Harmonia axyridis]|uniref:putative exonuclease GOR isoform X1 n=1 Tax=Harmonia axyridis TaxID=115357 RepID=UPI001E277990|nr:putative exonuclease GOR isoform X1 [Harmonia axyridis]